MGTVFPVCGDVVLDSLNKTSRDEDNILDKIYKSKYVRIIIMMILINLPMVRSRENKMAVFVNGSPILYIINPQFFIHTNNTVALKPSFMSYLLLYAVLKKNILILQILLKFKIFIIKI